MFRTWPRCDGARPAVDDFLDDGIGLPADALHQLSDFRKA
jgi:hypothetical protein